MAHLLHPYPLLFESGRLHVPRRVFCALGADASRQARRIDRWSCLYVLARVHGAWRFPSGLCCPAQGLCGEDTQVAMLARMYLAHAGERAAAGLTLYVLPGYRGRLKLEKGLASGTYPLLF